MLHRMMRSLIRDSADAMLRMSGHTQADRYREIPLFSHAFRPVAYVIAYISRRKARKKRQPDSYMPQRPAAL